MYHIVCSVPESHSKSLILFSGILYPEYIYRALETLLEGLQSKSI
jgi:hypothetical protein